MRVTVVVSLIAAMPTMCVAVVDDVRWRMVSSLFAFEML